MAGNDLGLHMKRLKKALKPYIIISHQCLIFVSGAQLFVVEAQVKSWS